MRIAGAVLLAAIGALLAVVGALLCYVGLASGNDDWPTVIIGLLLLLAGVRLIWTRLVSLGRS